VKSPNSSDAGSGSFSGSLSAFGMGNNAFQQYGSNKLQLGQQQSYSQQTSSNQGFDSMLTQQQQQQQGNSSSSGGTSGCMQQQYQPQQQMLFQQPQQQQGRTDHHRSGNSGQRTPGPNTQGAGGSVGAPGGGNQSFPHKINSPFVGQQIQSAGM